MADFRQAFGKDHVVPNTPIYRGCPQEAVLFPETGGPCFSTGNSSHQRQRDPRPLLAPLLLLTGLTHFAGSYDGGQREIRCNADADEVAEAVAAWVKEHGYSFRSEGQWLFQTIPEGKTVGSLHLAQLEKPSVDEAKLNAADAPHAGIVFAKQGNRSLGEIVRFLKLLSDCLDNEDMKGQVEYL